MLMAFIIAIILLAILLAIETPIGSFHQTLANEMRSGLLSGKLVGLTAFAIFWACLAILFGIAQNMEDALDAGGFQNLELFAAPGLHLAAFVFLGGLVHFGLTLNRTP
ncbi:MAG: hypothetical protein COY40_03615 [Alphaproteobacteria bacterium CG_4_10_14_0_8_um_filter_53_9]|nr:MAG: hypothetical protein COY40_03615 [Alphaproteobacteria bacterium CG_4_10_14_0_8_um_filter_53_9]